MWLFLQSRINVLVKRHFTAKVCISSPRSTDHVFRCWTRWFAQSRGVLQSGCVGVWRQALYDHSFENLSRQDELTHMGVRPIGRSLFPRSRTNVKHFGIVSPTLTTLRSVRSLHKARREAS